MEKNTTDRCPEHPDAFIIQDYRSGDQICQQCGLIVGDRITDVGGEWRTFNSERAGPQSQSRVGGAENPFSSGCDLTTVIRGPEDTPTFGRAPRRRGRYGRILNEDEIMSDARKLIEEIAGQSHLPKSLEIDAGNKFKAIHNEKILKDRSKNSIAAACLYISCRQEKLQRTVIELCNTSCSISKKEVGRCLRLVAKVLPNSLSPSTAAEFIPRYCSKLQLPKSVEDAAVSVANNATDFDLVGGKSIFTVAGAAIYLASQASKDPKSLVEVSEAVGIATITIRQGYKLMYPQAESLFPTDFYFHTPVDQLPIH